ncbi:MAG: GntR family transcriptional regulator [Sulfitobacter sp.]
MTLARGSGNGLSSVPVLQRKTSADHVFDHLFEKISSLELLPGAKLSEADVARQMNVSRQPVRDAFNRLDNINLLLIRPQKATEVRRFSNNAIAAARFLRETVEVEVLRRAASNRTTEDLDELNESLEEQRAAIAEGAQATFHDLDALFHEKICWAGKVPYAFDVIRETKSQIDRLCLLSIAQDSHMDELYADHSEIVRLLAERDEEASVKAGMKHLARLDATIEAIRADNEDYFED